MGVQVPTGTRVSFQQTEPPFARSRGQIIEHKIVKRAVFVKRSGTGRTRAVHEIHRYRVRVIDGEGRLLNMRLWLDRGDFEIER